MIINNEIRHLLNEQCNHEEVFYQEYKKILHGLNKTISKTKEPLEGNIFYYDLEKDRSSLHKGFSDKRKLYAMFASVCDVVVEIGFNGGHSAMLALTANKSLNYVGIDVGIHRYTVPCFNYLKQIYGDRIELRIGDSKNVLPNIFNFYPEIRNKKIGWVIDGSHTVHDANADISNVIDLAAPNDVVLFDDADVPYLRNLLDMYTISGDIQVLKDNEMQLFFKVTKNC
jgi:hypothetical protein